jgi:hypothetical protein
MSVILRAIALLLLTISLTQCAGYVVGSQKPSHLRNISKLAIPTFQNDTLEPRLGSLATNAVIKQVQNEGAYQIVSRDRAEAVMEARVSRIDRSQFRASRQNVLRSSQLQMRVTIAYSIREVATGRILHQSSANSFSYIILDRNQQNSEAQALEDATQRASHLLANQICEGW